MSYAYPPQPVYRSYPVRTTAPVSLHVVAVFQYLGGLLALGLGALLALAAAGAAPRFEYRVGNSAFTDRPDAVTAAVVVVCGMFVLLGITAIVLGRKVQRGRNWARVVLTVLNSLSIAATVWQAYTLGRFDAQALAGIALPVLFVVLLNTSAARSWCRSRTY